ncbi:hypothetical protein [Paludibacterium paludis]|uniref:Uncharacterized protein n=1 Tax=Paludibacterium paludis TaxID=1225769 RepID=A0A918P079_9NEIS|nr:hypothetical protein [Paludibacterium paludis]GGY10756.1 hypothetical protein GCM10011289_11920 [Paludibacterium paludis]
MTTDVLIGLEIGTPPFNPIVYDSSDNPIFKKPFNRAHLITLPANQINLLPHRDESLL